MKKSLKFNALINVLRVCSGMILSLLTFPYISRVLGPTNLGSVNFASSIISYFLLFSSLGIPTYGMLECARSRNDKVKLKQTVAELLSLNIALCIIVYTVFFVLLGIIPQFKEYKTLLLINSITIFFTAIGIEWLYSAIEEFAYISIRSLLFKLISLILYYIFIKDENDFILYSFITVFANSGSFVLNFIHARKYIDLSCFKRISIRKHLKPIITLFMASIATTINANTDMVMLGFIYGSYQVGLYDFAVKLKNIVTNIMTSALMVLVPRFSNLLACKDYVTYKKILRRALYFMLTIGVYLSIFFTFFVKDIILLLGGNKYVDSEIAIIIFNVNIIVLSFSWVFGVGVLQPSGREDKYAKGVSISCALNVLLNIVLIPLFKLNGAALSTLLSEFCCAVIFYKCSEDIIGEALKNMKLMRIFISSLISIFVTYNLSMLVGLEGLLRLTFAGFISITLFFVFVMSFHAEIRNVIFNEFFKRNK